MRITPAIHMSDTVTVHVDPGELQCDVRALPYGCCIGTINTKTGKLTHWTPAASVPRGYKRAALAMLETAWDQIQKERAKGEAFAAVALRIGN